MLPQQLACLSLSLSLPLPLSLSFVVSACKWLYLNFKCVNCARVAWFLPFPGASVPSFGLRPDRLSLITAQVKHTVAKWKLQPLSLFLEWNNGWAATMVPPSFRSCSIPTSPGQPPSNCCLACQGDIIISVAGPRTSFISFKFCVIVMRFKRFPW